MEIFGLGIVGICMIVGIFIGRLLGLVLGVNGDVGGVGFAMLLMILITQYLESKGKPISKKTGDGIRLLSSLYIPIVVAMSSIQNVTSALNGGVVALLAGVLGSIGGLLLVPVISKLGKKSTTAG
ncbi:MAG: malonate transporter subunit MadL [Tissierellia bacterium]|nr:malonate transporter subunit MadL [Tissierellia bacterium]